MEIVENQVYERPKERKLTEDISENKTPCVRRKHNSQDNDLDNQKHRINTEVNKENQRKPPHKPKSPKPEYRDQNGDVIKKVVRKKPKHTENSEPFERPQPRASPRPPRTPPPPDYEAEKAELKSSQRQISAPENQEKEQLIESIPPPLPEKKNKMPKSSENIKKIEELENPMSTESQQQNSVEDNLPPQTIIVPTKVLSDNKNDASFMPVPNINQETSSQKNATSQQTENSELNNNAMIVSCDSSKTAMIVNDNSTVISQKESLNPQCLQSEKPKTAPAIQNEKSELNHSEISKIVESASGKLNASAESVIPLPSQSSVGESGVVPARPVQVTQFSEQNLSPKTLNDLTMNQGGNNKNKNAQPLVKPFPTQPTNTKPIEFPNKNLASPDPSSNKPPWVKSENKTIASNEAIPRKDTELQKTPKSPSKEPVSPSINNSKIGHQKSI